MKYARLKVRLICISIAYGVGCAKTHQLQGRIKSRAAEDKFHLKHFDRMCNYRQRKNL